MLKKNTSKFIITGGFLGYSPLFPGTIGSILGCFFIWYARDIFSSYHNIYVILPIWLLLLIISTLLVHYFITYVVNEHDPSYIIIDEIIAQILIFIFIPITIQTLISGFILFRIFDIFKIFGIKYFENLPGAFGIMLDDIIAGIYTIICLYAFLPIFTLLISKISIN